MHQYRYNQIKHCELFIVQLLEVSGIDLSADKCNSCPPGMFSDHSRATDCKECPRNTFTSRPAQTECQPCSALDFSYPGSTGCTRRPGATPDDQLTLLTPSLHRGRLSTTILCLHPARRYSRTNTILALILVRTLTYEFIEPVICNKQSITLPPTQNQEPCGILFRNDLDYTHYSALQCWLCEKWGNMHSL